MNTTELIRRENIQRRAAYKGPMTPDEERAFLGQQEQKQARTQAAESSAAQIGSTRTTPKGGAKIVSGPYKGMHPNAAMHAAVTAAPVPTGKSGYVRGGPLSGGAGLPTRAPVTAAPMFSGLTAAPEMPKVPVPAPSPGLGSVATAAAIAANSGIDAQNAANQQTAANTAAAIAGAYMDNKNMGMVERGPNGVAFDSGARIMPGPGGTKTVISGYGSGSAAPVPAGQKATDPVLAAEIAAINARQQGGTFTPSAATPAYAGRATAAPTPPPAAAPAPNVAQGWNRPGWPVTVPPGQPGYVDPNGRPSAAPWRNAEVGPPRLQALPDVNAGPPVAARSGVAPAAPAPAPAAPPTPAKTATAAPTPRPLDPALTDPRGFASPDPTNRQNWDFRPLPQTAADNLRTIAGRGDDMPARLLQVFNPFTTVQTLRQGGDSALPTDIMGAQPTYPNANDRLKGDSDTIKKAVGAGQIKTTAMPDKFGGPPKVQVAVPFLRGTNTPVRPWAAKPQTAAPSPRPPALITSH